MTSKTSSTALEFTVSLQDWIRVDVKGSVLNQRLAVAFDLFRALTLATPVGYPAIWASLENADGTRRKPPKGYVGGTARASWFVVPFRPEPEPEVKRKPGSQEGLGEITTWKNSPEVWIANNLPYIERIMESGWSTQAPPGTFSGVFLRIRRKWGLV